MRQAFMIGYLSLFFLDLNPPPGPPEYQAAYYDACMTAAQENNQNIFALHGRG